MTEALRPNHPIGIGLGAGAHTAAPGADGPTTLAAARPAPRPKAKAAEARRPLHLAVAVGLSAGAYAAALAGVTAVQSSSEQALAAYHAPTLEAIGTLRAEHDRLEARLAAAADAYNGAAAAYGELTGGLGKLEQGLGTLAAQVTKVEGSAMSMPTAARLPSVGRSSGSASRPATHATTCASGKVCP
jgi:hypothetical protein